jgi:hypothetical protein
MGLFNANVRLRSLLANGTLDKRCAPVNETVVRICTEPTVKNSLSGNDTPFPNSA